MPSHPVPRRNRQDDLVLDGEVRIAAAKALGLATVPCIRVDHLTDVEQRMLRLAVNRLGEKGEWDLAELRIEFEELILADAPIEKCICSNEPGKFPICESAPK